VDQEAEHDTLDFFYGLQKVAADQRNVIIIELEGFGSRKRTIYSAKRT
jgi:hypothetical protein